MTLLLAMLAAQTANNLPDNAYMPPPKQVGAMVAEYGDCIVKREQARASAAILAHVNVDEMLRRHPQLLQKSCVQNKLGDFVEVTFWDDQYRYAIAEALVRRELAALPPPVLDDVPALDHRGPQAPPRVDAKGRPLQGRALERAMRDYDQQRASNYMWRYGECVVRVDPVAAKALLLTEPASAAENARFKAMGTALGTCLAEGRSLEFGKADLRGTIAVNYYRLAIAARQTRPERG